MGISCLTKKKEKKKRKTATTRHKIHVAQCTRLTHTQTHNARSLLMVKTYSFWLARMWFLCFSFLFSLLFLFCLVLTSKCHNTSTLTTHGREGIVLIIVFDCSGFGSAFFGFNFRLIYWNSVDRQTDTTRRNWSKCWFWFPIRRFRVR